MKQPKWQTDRQNVRNSGFQTISGNERQLLRERKTHRLFHFPSFLPYEGFQAVAKEEETRAEPSQFSELRILCLRTELEIWGDQGGQNLQDRVLRGREATHRIWRSAGGLPQVRSVTRECEETNQGQGNKHLERLEKIIGVHSELGTMSITTNQTGKLCKSWGFG